jgi:DNA replication and repair protein RecF
VRLTRLKVTGWRNLASAELTAEARFVVLHGDNAQGKTNLLEAVYMLASLRSFREHRPKNLIGHGGESARIEGDVQGTSGLRRMSWSYSRSGVRELKLDDGPPGGLRDWFAPIRAILFCPEHIAIVRGGPEERRGFIDRARFTARPAYLELVRDYRRALKQKGALLRGPRSPSDAELDIWDARLAALGSRMALQRLEIVAQLRGPFQEMMAQIAGKEQVDLQLRGLGIPGVTEGSLRDRLQRARAAERGRRMILTGPHRDDVAILLDGRSARRFASQGQARSIVLALKLAELEAARRRGEAPLFLLDDLTSELDARRRGRLVQLLAAMESQVWITTTDPAYLGPLPADLSSRWLVEGGSVRSGDN